MRAEVPYNNYSPLCQHSDRVESVYSALSAVSVNLVIDTFRLAKGAKSAVCGSFPNR